MEILGAPSGLATFRPRYCCCFIIRSRCLSAPSPPSSFRMQIQFHPWSKQLFRIIPKAQSVTRAAPDEFLDESNDDVRAARLRRNRIAYARRRKKAVERLDKQLLEGVKPPYVEYLMGLGLDLDDIRGIVRKYCYIRHRSVDGQIRPFVEALRNFGMDHKRLLAILRRCPEALRVSVEKKFMPTMAYLESLGMDKEQCIKAVCRWPRLLILTRDKIEENVAYFLEPGVSAENVGKIIVNSPLLLGLTERRIRRKTEFFLANGFTKEELQRMVVRFPNIYCKSLTNCIIPKWEFFLEMGYPTSYLVNFPQYFGYSLEGRIKPRHKKLAMEHGVRLHFSTFLSCTDTEFEMLLEKLVSRRSSKDGGNCST